MRTLERLALAAGMLAVAAAPALAARGITVKGSDTMVILGQRWAERYMTTHSGEVIQVTGGGSGTGIAALINGTTDICQASRPMKQAEKIKLRDRYKSMGTEIPVARDGPTIYVHESNPLKEVTIEQQGSTRSYRRVQRIYAAEELDQTLREARFSVLGHYSDAEGKPFDRLTSTHVVTVAART